MGAVATTNAALAAKVAALEERLDEDETIIRGLMRRPCRELSESQLYIERVLNSTVHVLGPNWKGAEITVWPDEEHVTIRNVPKSNRPDGGYDVSIRTLVGWINRRRGQEGQLLLSSMRGDDETNQ